jgi:hypothetical protein
VNAPIIYVDGEKDAYACSPEFHGRVLLIPRGSWVSRSRCVSGTRGVRSNPFTTFHLYPQPHIVLRIVTHQRNHYLIFTGYPLVDALASAFGLSQTSMEQTVGMGACFVPKGEHR